MVMSSVIDLVTAKTVSQRVWAFYTHTHTHICIYIYIYICSDRILTCRIKSIRSPAKVGLVVTDLITSPVVSWEGWETPPPAPRLCCHSLLNHRRGKTSLSCGDLLLSSARLLFTFGGC